MKANDIARRREAVMDYINSFKNSKCRQPMSRIAYLLYLSPKVVRLDINHLIKEGMITTTFKQRGYRKYRCLIGDPTVQGKFKHPEVKKEEVSILGYTYLLPVELPRHTQRYMVTSYASRPKRNGKALPIDWEYWDTVGVIDTPKPTKIPPYFAPFDMANYTVHSWD